MATQIDYVTQIKNKPTIPVYPTVISSDYQWSFTPPSNLAIVSGVESTATFTTLPTGLNQTNSINKHYIGVVYSTSSHTSFLVTSVNDSTKVVKFMPTVSIAAGNWTLRSASGGVQEAIYANVGDAIYVPAGDLAYDALKVWINRANITIRGAGKKATTFVINSPGANGFWSDTYGYEVHDIRFEPINSGTQTSGAMISLVGTTAKYSGEADITVTGCEFESMYNNVNYDCPGGFIRYLNNMSRNNANNAIYHKSSSAGALQICDNYFDGPSSPGLIWIESILGGGIIADNWMQAANSHIVINGTAGTPINELVITGNIIDNDRVSTVASIVVNGDGVEGNSSNNIQILSNYFSSVGYCVLAQNACNVYIKANKFYARAAIPMVAIGGTTTRNIVISDNGFWSTGVCYAIQVSATNTISCNIFNNTGVAAVSCPAFIGVVGAVTNLVINGNSCGTNYTKLVADVGVTGAGQVQCKNNAAVNQPILSLTSTNTITLPLADEEQIIGIAASTNTITAMLGVSARAGCRRTFITDGAVSWGTSTASDNRIGKAYAATAAGDVVTWYKFNDNLWYPSK